MAMDLFVVDFDDIYEALLENEEPMNDREECLGFLQNSDSPNVRKWLELAEMNSDVLTDISTIVEYYLEENGE